MCDMFSGPSERDDVCTETAGRSRRKRIIPFKGDILSVCFERACGDSTMSFQRNRGQIEHILADGGNLATGTCRYCTGASHRRASLMPRGCDTGAVGCWTLLGPSTNATTRQKAPHNDEGPGQASGKVSVLLSF